MRIGPGVIRLDLVKKLELLRNLALLHERGLARGDRPGLTSAAYKEIIARIEEDVKC